MAKKKENTDTAENVATATSDGFEYNGKNYKFVIQKFKVPEIGVLTAKEAATEPKVLEYLVSSGSAVIEEVA